MTTLLHSATAVDARGERPDAWLLFDGDTIAATGSGADRPAADETVDLSGRWITPGFIDLHGHGGGGEDYATGDRAVALAAHRAHGTTRSVVSLVAEPVEVLEQQLARVARAVADDPRVLGSHLEGPFLAESRRGAHSAEMLRSPDDATVDRLLAAAAGTLRQVTIAPELPGAVAAIRRFASAGVIVAIGHTDADAATAHAAFDAGATLLTHAFNAMPGIHHRAPGPVAAAIEDERVSLELVLDGRHVDPSVAAIAFAAAPGRVALVTDAMAAAAAGDGPYRLGSLDVSVRAGVATIAGTETIAGSTLTQDVALGLAVERLRLPRSEAVAALTATPARILRLDHRLGLLASGFAADVVVLDDTFAVQTVWAAGLRV
ncbi:N-acetylglucosamine-6-phosphate deacetylase [Pseudolysinimonas yzui]|uniref:N-acetylglucosamine-6-phosphate deacetylase n=1 Tax=Pseudolysinimonas yzui TaxID=2708254 RepID=A0A8J3GRN8_9MICO|nr:N-acetylglucosamine-6-phosphate deacetylase [Pseudolysinimonas yzui]GHF19996.1 N-acetylglucosamine-6-phosphate deacetylase [Pseudolysinimonas yzui]